MLMIKDLRLEARVRIELTIEVLQTSALPLGYRASQFTANCRRKPDATNEKPSPGQGFEVQSTTTRTVGERSAQKDRVLLHLHYTVRTRRTSYTSVNVSW